MSICASCHNAVYFFNISTSKSAPNPSVFNTFDLEMRFAPPRRALFGHLDFQKCSEAEVLFCTFWLGHVLRATTVQFFISHLGTWLRTRRFSEPTFRPSQSHKTLKKTQCFATFLPFRTPASSFDLLLIFFWSSSDLLIFSPLLVSSPLLSSPLFSSLLFSSLPWLFPPLLFRLSILVEIWLLNFLR